MTVLLNRVSLCYNDMMPSQCPPSSPRNLYSPCSYPIPRPIVLLLWFDVPQCPTKSDQRTPRNWPLSPSQFQPRPPRPTLPVDVLQALTKSDEVCNSATCNCVLSPSQLQPRPPGPTLPVDVVHAPMKSNEVCNSDTCNCVLSPSQLQPRPPRRTLPVDVLQALTKSDEVSDYQPQPRPPEPTMEEDPEKLVVDMRNMFDKKRPQQSHRTSVVLKSMESGVRRIVKSAQSNATAAKRLMDFANTRAVGEEKVLRVTSTDVPNGILPEGYKGVLHDIKVNGRQADDSVYNKHPDIRQMIPRGTTVLDLKQVSKDGSSEKEVQDVVIYANRKFTGDIGDEDDLQPENNDQWQKYFLKDQEEASSVVCMEKVNGEAAHFSGRFIDGQFYLITGSKNVHMIIKEEEDIDKYEGERYKTATVVARCVWRTLQELEEEHRRFLQDFLNQTKCTAICELLQPDNQHIMNLSHLKEPLLTVISFTSPATSEDASSLVALPPHHTLDLLSSLGFEVPRHSVIPVEDMQKHREEIRQGKHGYRTEGEVLYFLDKHDETIGLVKTKTMWYIMLRALREKVVYTARRKQGWSLQDRIDSTHRRFAEIQEWLHFPDSYLESWESLATSFMKWMEDQMDQGDMTPEKIRPQYPVVWERFLKENDLTDKVEYDAGHV